jgi:hypothetical protein
MGQSFFPLGNLSEHRIADHPYRRLDSPLLGPSALSMCTLPHQYSTPQVIHYINRLLYVILDRCRSEEWTLKGTPESVGRSVRFYIQ